MFYCNECPGIIVSIKLRKNQHIHILAKYATVVRKAKFYIRWGYIGKEQGHNFENVLGTIIITIIYDSSDDQYAWIYYAKFVK